MFHVAAVHHGEQSADRGISDAAARFPAGLHQIGGRFMAGERMSHAPDNREFISNFRQFLHVFAQENAVDIGRDLAASSVIIAVGFRFRIERFQLTRSAPDPQFDHGFGGFARFQGGDFHAGKCRADPGDCAKCPQRQTVFQKFSAIHNGSFPELSVFSAIQYNRENVFSNILMKKIRILPISRRIASE